MRIGLLALVLAVAATPARADDRPGSIAEAMRLEAALDYEGALAIVERMIAQGGSNTEQLVNLHMFAGKLAAGLERGAVAEDHFARAIAMDQMSGFQEGTSPKIVERFEAARARTKPLEVRMVFDDNVVTLHRSADPLGLVVGVAVTIKERDGATSEERQPNALRVVLPASTKTRDFEVRALDRHGNTVWSELAAYIAPATTTTTTQARPLYKRWTFWAATAAVFVAAGGLSAWRFDSAQHEFDEKKAAGTTDFTELQAIEDRGRRWGLAANIGFGASAVAGVVAIAFAF